MELDKQSYIPLSKQFEILIETQIIQGKFSIGDILPPQKYYEKLYDISRITVRQAMSALIEKGVLESFKGKGTFVRTVPGNKDIEYHSHAGFSYQYSKKHSVETKVLSFSEIVPTKEVASAMGLSDKDQVIRLERQRFVDNIPVSLECNFLDPNIIKIDLSKYVVDNTSLYEILETHCNISVYSTVEDISAVISDERTGKYLALEEPTPLLAVKRKTFSIDLAFPFEYCSYHMISGYYGPILMHKQKKESWDTTSIHKDYF